MNHSELTRHMDWLFRMALRLCGDTEDAQELTQETLLAALQARHEPDDLPAWLTTVLRRRHADLLRRWYRLPTVCIDSVPEPSAPETGDTAEREVLIAQVRREVAFLAGKYREAIIRHYLHGEKVAEVAAALEIPEGTVLSRLSAGRAQLRKGLNSMEEYGQQSYQPERLDVSCNGLPGLHDEPWSLVCDDLIRQNILIAAYDAPVTPVEISRHLGVPTAYVEAAVDALVKGELMQRTGSRVFTDFLITTPAQREKGIELQIGLVQKQYATMMSPVRAMAEAICASGFYARLHSDEQRKLREYFTLHLLSTAIYTATRRIVPAEEVFPDRPNGGSWIACGYRVPMNFDWAENPFRHYTYGGERSACWEQFMDAKSVTLRVYDVQPDLNRYQRGPVGMDEAALCRLLYILHRGLSPSDTGIDPALLQDIPHLTSCGVLRTSNGKPECAVPILTKAEHAALEAVRTEQMHVLADILEPLLRTIFPMTRVPLPAHLSGRVAEFRRYSSYAIPMALREACIQRGDWTDAPHAPAMVLVIES